jgi:UDP:flavonoid glycosyltransferase YjiC (YdhE family)
MRIAFAALPAYGHVFPMAPLAQAVATAGHEVTFAADRSFGDRLPVPVVQSVPDGLTLHDVEEEAKVEVVDSTDPMAWPTAIFGVVSPRHTVPRLLDAWSGDARPDLVIHEGANAGAALASQRLGIPSVCFHIALAPPEMFRSLLTRVVQLPDEPVLDPRPPSFRPPASPETVPIRSVAWADPTAAAPTWLDEGAEGATAFITLGTVAFGAVDALRRSVLEAADVCARVLVAVGPAGDPGLLGPVPDHVRLERFVDQATAFDRADVAVHHGGTGTVLAGLAAGVPQVITPQGADQFMNAELLGGRGVAAVVRNDEPAGAIRAALERVLGDERLREQVASVRDEIAAMPSPAEVAGRLEQYAS